MRKDAPIYVAGEDTFIGAALVRRLTYHGFRPSRARPGGEPDLTRRHEVDDFFARFKPEYVFMAAGKSGGIAANQKYPADFMLDNMLVSANVIDAAYRHGVRKLLYLASSCCYPRQCPQPMKAQDLMTGPLEPTSEPYALAKIAGIKLCQAYRRQYKAPFIVGIPANAYGPGDCLDPEDSHVILALMRRMHEAGARGQEAVTIWGSGAPRREFIYVDDLADACVLVMEHYDEETPVNLGVGEECSIRELAEMIRDAVGFPGKLEFDTARPDGMPSKALEASRLRELGWRPATSLREGLRLTYHWFRDAVS